MQNEMRTLTAADGDLRTIWDPNVAAEVEQAREQFDKMRRKGYAAYRVGTDGGKAEVMNSFDPTASKIILAPVVAGG